MAAKEFHSWKPPFGRASISHDEVLTRSRHSCLLLETTTMHHRCTFIQNMHLYMYKNSYCIKILKLLYML